MSEMHLIRQPGFTYSTCRPFPKNKENKNLNKQEIQNIFIKKVWPTEILIIYIEEQLLIKYNMIKHLGLLKLQNMVNINVDLLQCFINFLIKSSDGAATHAWSETLARRDESVLKNEMKLCQTSN